MVSKRFHHRRIPSCMDTRALKSALQVSLQLRRFRRFECGWMLCLRWSRRVWSGLFPQGFPACVDACLDQQRKTAC